MATTPTATTPTAAPTGSLSPSASQSTIAQAGPTQDQVLQHVVDVTGQIAKQMNVAPGQVTQSQANVLAQQNKGAMSSYQQYMDSIGLANMADPDSFQYQQQQAYVNGQGLVEQATMSHADMAIGLNALSLNSSTYIDLMKQEQAEHEQHTKELLGAVEIAAAVVGGFFTGGATWAAIPGIVSGIAAGTKEAGS